MPLTIKIFTPFNVAAEGDARLQTVTTLVQVSRISPAIDSLPESPSQETDSYSVDTTQTDLTFSAGNFPGELPEGVIKSRHGNHTIRLKIPYEAMVLLSQTFEGALYLNNETRARLEKDFTERLGLFPPK